MFSHQIPSSSKTSLREQMINHWDISAEQSLELLKYVPEGETQTVMVYLNEIMTPLTAWLYPYRLAENRLHMDRSDVSDMGAFDFESLHHHINYHLSGPASIDLEKITAFEKKFFASVITPDFLQDAAKAQTILAGQDFLIPDSGFNLAFAFGKAKIVSPRNIKHIPAFAETMKEEAFDLIQGPIGQHRELLKDTLLHNLMEKFLDKNGKPIFTATELTALLTNGFIDDLNQLPNVIGRRGSESLSIEALNHNAQELSAAHDLISYGQPLNSRNFTFNSLPPVSTQVSYQQAALIVGGAAVSVYALTKCGFFSALARPWIRLAKSQGYLRREPSPDTKPLIRLQRK